MISPPPLSLFRISIPALRERQILLSFVRFYKSEIRKKKNYLNCFINVFSKFKDEKRDRFANGIANVFHPIHISFNLIPLVTSEEETLECM